MGLARERYLEKQAKDYDKVMTELNNAWSDKFDMIIQMFEAVVKEVQDNERVGRLSIEILRDNIEAYYLATSQKDIAEATRKMKQSASELVAFYDDMGYATIGEWFRQWTLDINAVNLSDNEAGEKMDQLIDEYGFEFKRLSKRKGPKLPTWKEMIGEN